MKRLTRWNGKKYVLPSTSNGPGVWREIAERLAEKLRAAVSQTIKQYIQ